MLTLCGWSIEWCIRWLTFTWRLPLPSLSMHGSSAVGLAVFLCHLVALSILGICVSTRSEVILTWSGLGVLGAHLDFS